MLFGVDYVAYVEGGQSSCQPIEAALNGSDETQDAAFWSAVFAVVKPDKRFHVKSVGSNGTVKSLAIMVARENISNVIVCSDSDVDGAIKSHVAEVPLVRTWGYSWENDICVGEVLRCGFKRLRGDSTRARD